MCEHLRNKPSCLRNYKRPDKLRWSRDSCGRHRLSGPSARKCRASNNSSLHGLESLHFAERLQRSQGCGPGLIAAVPCSWESADGINLHPVAHLSRERCINSASRWHIDAKAYTMYYELGLSYLSGGNDSCTVAYFMSSCFPI